MKVNRQLDEKGFGHDDLVNKIVEQ